MHLNNIRKYFFSKDNRLLFLGFVLFISACFLNEKVGKPIIHLSKQDTAININNDLLIFMSAGNKRLLTDLIWVQTLIESDLERYRTKDLNNWLYLRFNTISLLDPKFYENYLYGGQFLNVIKDDLLGADLIYAKGVLIYPDDYQLNYYAGIMNYFEIGNYKKGYDYLVKIQDNPKAPVYIRSIVNKLALAKGANLEDIFKLVLHHYETTKDEALRSKLKSDLYAIKAEIDIKCLNTATRYCDHVDLDGKPYIKTAEGYKTYKMFLPYRINRKGEPDKAPQSRSEINTFK